MIRYADPFHTVGLPQVIEEFLDLGTAKCIAFNRWGTLLAGELLALARCKLPLYARAQHCCIKVPNPWGVHMPQPGSNAPLCRLLTCAPAAIHGCALFPTSVCCSGHRGGLCGDLGL